MKPSEKAYEIIRLFEGLSLRACKAIPSEKYYSIGYGHYSKDIRKGQLITQQQAEEYLHQDVATFADKLSQDAPHLAQHQYDALCSLIYNIGWYAYRYSMTRNLVLNAHKSGKDIYAARRIILWTKAGGQTLLGLQKRRVYEANYFLGREVFTLKNNQIIEYR